MSIVSFTAADIVLDSVLDESMGYANIDERARSLMGSGTEKIIRAGDVISEEAEARNIIKLLPGTHQGFSLSKPFTYLSGSAGVIATRVVTIENNATIENIYFRQDNDESNINHLVHVTGTSRVVFRNCTFQRKHDAPSAVDAPLPAPPAIRDCFVLVEPGARAMFIGCVFRSDYVTGAMNGTGTVVQSLNPAAGSVFVGAGSNFTTHVQGTTVTVFAPEI